MSTLLIFETVATFYLTGLIWTIQVTHYPSFRFISPQSSTAFHLHHTRAMTKIVMLPMIVELICAVALAYLNPSVVSISSVVAVVAIWGFTFAFSVPIHNQLEKNWDRDLVEKLIRSNWPRTILWSVRSVALFIVCFQQLV